MHVGALSTQACASDVNVSPPGEKFDSGFERHAREALQVQGVLGPLERIRDRQPPRDSTDATLQPQEITAPNLSKSNACDSADGPLRSSVPLYVFVETSLWDPPLCTVQFPASTPAIRRCAPFSVPTFHMSITLAS